MPAKESRVQASDDSTQNTRTPGDLVALAISTCGVGYLPLAPGTFGAIVGIGLALLVQRLVILASAEPGAVVILSPMVTAAVHVPVILLITFVGIWAASRTERVLKTVDPGKVVVDEVAGQMISLLPVLLLHDWPGFRWVIVSFILFRFFDIVKPYPARRFEALHGGLGIMADDLVAGVYGAIVTLVLLGVFGKLNYLVSVLRVM